MTSLDSQFNILDRHQLIHQHGVLEASAGTGKTFAIENLVVRFLIENNDDQDPLLLEQILVVTFTRAATLDLKSRIQSKLQNAISYIKKYLILETNQHLDPKCPDYLRSQLELGPIIAKKALKRLEQALFTYDQAQIFTIHGFCFSTLKKYALEGNISFASSFKEEGSLEKRKLTRAIRDFLRTELQPEHYSTSQLNILLSYNRINRDLDKLEQQLLSTVSRGIEISSPMNSLKTFSELFNEFQSIMESLQKTHSFQPQHIIDDFLAQAPFYNKLADKKGELKPADLKRIHRFADLFSKETYQTEDFDQLLSDGIFIVEALDPSRLAKKNKSTIPPKLHYPHLIDTLKSTLAPLVDKGRHPAKLFARLARDCQIFIDHYRYQEELIGHNNLLAMMGKAIEHPQFAQKVRTKYHAAIIDEFQDTDPIQWKIFSSLFLNEKWKGFFYIIGDPKQSIYAFRQADIYTYLHAAQQLGSKAFSTLDTNFRSQPTLVSGLNKLFTACDHLFPLPKQTDSLNYRSVEAGITSTKTYSDQGACVQFWIVKGDESQKKSPKDAEETYFFTAIANELLSLKSNDAVSFRQSAILIANRFQGVRLSKYLKRRGIPVKNQKGIDLSKSSAVESMREIINGILHFRDQSLLKTALTGKLIGMTHDEILLLFSLETTNQSRLTILLQKCNQLRQTLFSDGFGAFYNQLMQSSWHFDECSLDKCSLLEDLLERENGGEFYSEWQDIADLLITKQLNSITPQGLLTYLDEFDQLASDEDENIKAFIDPNEDGVSLLTTHASKGLEFDIVFTLGAITRTKQSSDSLVVIEQENRQYLIPVENDQDPHYQQFCKESDAEKMRQIYVAFTRAKYRLYIPVFIADPKTKIAFGTASPMELLLARLGQPSTDYEGWYRRINEQNDAVIQNFIEKQGCGENKEISSKYLNENTSLELNPNIQQDNSNVLLIPPPQITLPSSPMIIQSFTSLQQHKEVVFSDAQWIPPHSYGNPIKTAHTLPAGPETGTLLHRILEILPYHSVKSIKDPNKLLPWITPLIQGTLFESWGSVLAQIVLETIKIPLPSSSTPFCLEDIHPKRIYREMEFLYPCQGNEPSLNIPENNNLHSGYLKGVIDLMFEHQGKYYFVDWKSNWLGPSSVHYHQKALKEVMESNGYDLQAQIYLEGIKRYLKLFSHQPFEEFFGGAYYIFLRGPGIVTSQKVME